MMELKIKNELFKDIDITANHGEALAMIGENGIGKSMLLKQLCGIFMMKNGIIKYDDNICFQFPLSFVAFVKWRRYIRHNVVFCDNADFLIKNLSIRENIDYYCGIMESNIEKVFFYLNELSMNESNEKCVSILSDGSKQKLALSLVLASNKNLVLLDEPEKCLDLNSIRKLYSLFEGLSEKCIIFSTHSKLVELNNFKVYEIKKSNKGIIYENVN